LDESEDKHLLVGLDDQEVIHRSFCALELGSAGTSCCRAG
jgi:hypothetical protein